VVVSPILSPSTAATRTSDVEALVDQASDLADEGNLEEATAVPDLVIEEGGDDEDLHASQLLHMNILADSLAHLMV
jgi:hypothetical protein